MGRRLHTLINVLAVLGVATGAVSLLSHFGAATWVAAPVALVLACPLLLAWSLLMGPMLDKVVDALLWLVDRRSAKQSNQ